MKFLDQAFTLSRAGCPLDYCRKPFVSHDITADGSAAKATFICAKGHPTTWCSSDQLGRQALLLNRLVPCAAVMSGLKIEPTRRFLGLLQVDSQGSSYVKGTSLDVLARLTNELFNEEIARVREEMKESPTFDLGLYSFFSSLSFSFYFILYPILTL